MHVCGVRACRCIPPSIHRLLCWASRRPEQAGGEAKPSICTGRNHAHRVLQPAWDEAKPQGQGSVPHHLSSPLPLPTYRPCACRDATIYTDFQNVANNAAARAPFDMGVLHLKEPIGNRVGGWFRLERSDVYTARTLTMGQYPCEYFLRAGLTCLDGSGCPACMHPHVHVGVALVMLCPTTPS